MKHFNVDLVVHGSTTVFPDAFGNDPYAVPKELGKYKNIVTGNDMSTENIIERIIANRLHHSHEFRLQPFLGCDFLSETPKKKSKKRLRTKPSKNDVHLPGSLQCETNTNYISKSMQSSSTNSYFRHHIFFSII